MATTRRAVRYQSHEPPKAPKTPNCLNPIGVGFARQVPVAVTYKSVAIGEARLDLLVADRLVVELKACPGLLPIHVAQVLSYLRACDRSLGLLINFNVPRLRQGIMRVIRTR